MRGTKWMRGLVGGAVALGVVLAGAAPARAQDAAALGAELGPGAVAVIRGLDDIKETVHRTTVAMGGAVDRATAAIARLDGEDRPVPAMIGAAEKGLGGVNLAGERGHQRVAWIVERTARVLSKVGAPAGAFEAIHAGGESAHQAIHERAEAARRAIGDALESALADEAPPAEAEGV